MNSEYSMDEDLRTYVQQTPVKAHIDKIKDKNKMQVAKFKQYAIDLK
jgi:hypothetical protein